MKYRNTVSGLICDLRFMKMQQKNIEVMITSDKLGKTLSLSDGEKMITIPLEKVDVLKVKK